MCFAPQRPALFRHLNFQKWSEPLVPLTFWLRNVLRAITACTFSTLQLPKVVRCWCVLYILTWKCASRHDGVHFSSLIWPDGSAPAALASLLFDPPEPQMIGKTKCFATFLPFRAPGSSFFWDFLLFLLLFSSLLFSSLTLPISAFHLSILSEVWLLNFIRSHINLFLVSFIYIYIYYICKIPYAHGYIYIYIYIYTCLYPYIYIYIFIYPHNIYKGYGDCLRLG